MVMKKRGAVYSVIALMLCAAVYLNYTYAKTNSDGTEPSEHEVDGKLIGQSILVSGDGQSDGDTADVEVNGTVSDDYFSTARLSRQKARDESVSILNSTIANENASEDAKAVASTNIQVMADNAMIESKIENLVMAKSYTDCVVFINDNGVNVIVAKPENGLSDTDVAKITDIVLGETTVAAEQIKIIPTD